MKFTASTIAALLSLCCSMSFAGGFHLYSESAADVLGVGGAGVARSGSTSLAWYNPAGTLTIDQPTITAGGTLIRIGSEFNSGVDTDDMVNRIRMTGFVYGVLPLSDDLRFTLSVNAPFGLVTQWKPNSQLNSVASFTSIRSCYISPGIAYRLNDQLSVAAGLNGVISVARMANYIKLGQYGMKDNKLYLRADGTGIGGFASLRYQPHDDWAFGLHYQSPVKLRLEGDARYRYGSKDYMNMLQFVHGDAHTTLYMPGYFAFGVENTSFEKWRLMFDAVWTQWSLRDKMDIDFEHLPASGKPGYIRSKSSWHDVWSYRFGAEYALNDNWTLRAGYMIDLSPSNDRYRSSEMPDSNKQLFALGVGYNTERWGFDLAYGYTIFDDAKLGSAHMKKLGLKRGDFETDVHLLSAQVTLRF